MPRQLSAIMFTDITGFTSLMAQNETKALNLLEQNRKIQKRLIKKYHGIWLKEVGDGIMACFSSVVNAIYCGNAIQQEVKSVQDLSLGIAIHIGEVVFSNGDVFGDGVNVASRIEEVAESDKICISGAAYENVKNIEGLSFDFSGDKSFKNVAGKVQVYCVKVDEEFKVDSPKTSLSFSKYDLPFEFEAPEKEDVDELKFRPGATSTFGYAWGVMKENFLHLFLVSMFLVFINVPLAAANDEGNATMNVLAVIFWLFLVTPVEYGVNYFYLRAVRKQEIAFKDIKVGFYYYLNSILARVLVTSIIGLGIFLLIVPGIIFACKLAFVPYLVVDEGLDPIEAAKKSWSMTRGHAWTIFGMGILSFFIILAGLIAFFVGVIVSVMWIDAAFASLYAKVSQEAEFKEDQ